MKKQRFCKSLRRSGFHALFVAFSFLAVSVFQGFFNILVNIVLQGQSLHGLNLYFYNEKNKALEIILFDIKSQVLFAFSYSSEFLCAIIGFNIICCGIVVNFIVFRQKKNETLYEFVMECQIKDLPFYSSWLADFSALTSFPPVITKIFTTDFLLTMVR